MTLESICANAGQLGEILDRTGRPIHSLSTNAGLAIRNEAKDLIASASEGIRRNPISFVTGAVILGVTVGYAIATTSQSFSSQDRRPAELD